MLGYSNSHSYADVLLSRVIGYYPTVLLDLMQLVFLTDRYWKLVHAGHSFHKGFPYSTKVKMFLLLILIFDALVETILVFITIFDIQLWIQYLHLSITLDH